MNTQENHCTLVNFSTGLAIISVNQLSTKPAQCHCICTRHMFFITSECEYFKIESISVLKHTSFPFSI